MCVLSACHSLWFPLKTIDGYQQLQEKNEGGEKLSLIRAQVLSSHFIFGKNLKKKSPNFPDIHASGNTNPFRRKHCRWIKIENKVAFQHFGIWMVLTFFLVLAISIFHECRWSCGMSSLKSHFHSDMPVRVFCPLDEVLEVCSSRSISGSLSVPWGS